MRSDDINDYLKDATGDDFSAKDFRTWSATVIAAVALAVSGPAHGAKTSRKRAITRAIKETAHYLGNTPAVCRASYIDPRIFDAYRGGLVLDHDGDRRGARRRARRCRPTTREIERAVLDLLDEREARRRGIEKLRGLGCGTSGPSGCGGGGSFGGGVSRSGVGIGRDDRLLGHGGRRRLGRRDRRGRLGGLRNFDSVISTFIPDP